MSFKYADSLKQVTDLLNKPYSYSKKAELAASADGIKYTAEAVMGKPSSLLLKGEFTYADFKVDKLQVSSDDKLVLEMSNTTLLKDTKLYFKGTDGSRAAGSQAITANMGAEFKSAAFQGTLDVNVLETASFPAVATGVFNYDNFFVGAELKAGLKTVALTDYNVLAGYKTKDTTFAAKTDKKVSAATIGIWQNVSPDMTVAGEAKFPVSGQSKFELVAGLAYKAGKDQTINAKLASSGKLGFSYAHQISKLFKLTLAAELDSANVASDDHKIGATLGFTA